MGSNTFDEQKCRICGCIWDNACPSGCYWVEDDLCSVCTEKLETEKIKNMIDEAPEHCPITGLSRCDSYIIDGNVVYLTEPAYDAYTLPVYDTEEQCFYRTKYDMDDDCRAEYEYLCHIDDLKNRDDFEEIKRFYVLD